MSTITCSRVCTLYNKEIFLFRIQNTSGAYIELINYGATLVSAVVPDRKGFLQNVILNFSNIEDYFSDSFYMGSTIGRLANRISNASFTLDGESFLLDKNDGQHCQHGGFMGFNSKVMEYSINDDDVSFYSSSLSGESGFPGNVQLKVAFRFTEDNEILIHYGACSDKRTPVNITNHAYFNLCASSENILDHELMIYANEYLEMNAEFLPTGKTLPVNNSPFDFNEYKIIKEIMPLKKEVLKGFNTYFINPDNQKSSLKKLASIKEQTSGRKMCIYSTMPGVLFYSGDYLTGKHKPFGGLCLEAQFYPDFPNHPHFPQSIIGPGKEFNETIKMEFSTFV